MMRAFLATILTVIAIGVLAIAYGLLNPRVATAQGGVVTIDPRDGSYQLARPVAYTTDRMTVPDDPYARGPMPYAVNDSRDVRDPRYLNAPRPASYTSRAPAAPNATRRVATVERAPKRDWQKTALVIGGSSAAGAGLGAIFGGGKGAAIGAAIGGGASTLFEVLHK
jgi:hypothetical protein